MDLRVTNGGFGVTGTARLPFWTVTRIENAPEDPVTQFSRLALRMACWWLPLTTPDPAAELRDSLLRQADFLAARAGLHPGRDFAASSDGDELRYNFATLAGWRKFTEQLKRLHHADSPAASNDESFQHAPATVTALPFVRLPFAGTPAAERPHPPVFRLENVATPARSAANAALTLRRFK